MVAVVPHAESTEASFTGDAKPKEHERGLEISSYGVVNYLNRDWDTDEFAKDTVDTERFVLELEYYFNDNWKATAEVEYEHGGTGATLELDSQEEFGEFEQEIENANANNVTDQNYNASYVVRDQSSADMPTFLPGNGRSINGGLLFSWLRTLT